MPGAEINKFLARRISKVFIAITTNVCTIAQDRRIRPLKTHIPRVISKTPMKNVALSAIPSPKIRPTIKRWRGMPLQILLYIP